MTDTDSIRVLLVAAATSTTGGGERHVADLLRGIPAASIEVALACPSGGDLGALGSSLGARVLPVEIASGYSLGQRNALRRGDRGVRARRGARPRCACGDVRSARRSPSPRTRRQHGARHSHRQGRFPRPPSGTARTGAATSFAHGGMDLRLRLGPRQGRASQVASSRAFACCLQRHRDAGTRRRWVARRIPP